MEMETHSNFGSGGESSKLPVNKSLLLESDEDDDDESPFENSVHSEVPDVDILDSTDDDAEPVSPYNESDDKELIQSNSKKLYECPECPYTSYFPRQYERHVQTHENYRCEMCKFSTKSKAEFQQHILSHTTKIELFDCTSCSFRCDSENTLSIHMLSHVRDKVFACDICDYTTTTKSRLKSHHRTHFDDEPISCNVCPFVCKTLIELHTHKKNHASPLFSNGTELLPEKLVADKVLSCNQCHFRSKMKHKLVKHLRQHERKARDQRLSLLLEMGIKEERSLSESDSEEMSSSSEENMNVTNEDFAHNGEMKEPDYLANVEVKEENGSILDTQEGYQDDLEEEEESHEEVDVKEFIENSEVLNSLGEAIPDPITMCDVSLEVQSTKEACNAVPKVETNPLPMDALLPHIANVCNTDGVSHVDQMTGQRKLLRCVECPYQGKTVSCMEKHMTFHKQNNKHNCHMCSFSSRTAKVLSEHIVCHFFFSCLCCPFQSSTSEEFDDHMLSHSDWNIYLCKLCVFQTNLHSELKQHHQDLHDDSHVNNLLPNVGEDGNQALPCNLCAYIAESLNALNHHMLMHFDVPSSVCRACGFTAPSILGFQMHLELHKTKKVLRCDECEFRCDSESDLRLHIKQHVQVQLIVCEICDFSCHFQTTLDKHIAEKHAL